jgi:hypothetical protein
VGGPRGRGARSEAEAASHEPVCPSLMGAINASWSKGTSAPEGGAALRAAARNRLARSARPSSHDKRAPKRGSLSRFSVFLERPIHMLPKQLYSRAKGFARYDQLVFGRPVSVLTKQLLYH